MRKYDGSATEQLEFSVKDKPGLTFHDFIILKFEEFVLPQELKIYETFNPGSVVRIFGYNENSVCWKLLWEAHELVHVEEKSREFRIQFEKQTSIVTR